MDPTERQAAERQVTVVLVLLGILFTLHVAGVGSTVLNLVREAMDPRGIFTALDPGLDDGELGERIGRAIGFLFGGVYSLLGLAWIPINFWALITRKPWAPASTLAYFATTLVTCCCAPFGAYGLYALFRRDVRALFDERRA